MGSIALDFERTLRGQPNEVRREMARALVELGFQVTSEQVTLIEAKRGSYAAGAVLGTSKMPVSATVGVVGGEDGICQVSVHLVDRVLGPSWGMNSQYQQIFGAIHAHLDANLSRLDPGAAAGFAAPRFTTRTASIPILEATQKAAGSFQDTATSKVNELLEGGPRTRIPGSWKQLDTVLLCASEGAARLQLEELQAHLAIAVLITSQPESMPPALAKQVEAFAVRVEAHLNQAGSNRYLEIGIGDAERPVVDFLHQQSRLREQLPVRTLHRCRTCKLERVTNPDLERLKKRNQRLRSVGASVGATLSRHGISPFVLVGSLFRFASLDPDYVCPRCQGTDSETRVVTYCPKCGDLRAEAALRTCPKCKFDIRTILSEEPSIWAPYPPPAPPTPVPVPPPQPAKVCSICGYSFPTLWRTVVAIPGGTQELFVCGRPPYCAPNSLVPPTQV